MKTPATEAERHKLRRNEMTVSDVAREIGYSTTQVYEFIHAGELPAWDGSKPGAVRSGIVLGLAPGNQEESGKRPAIGRGQNRSALAE